MEVGGNVMGDYAFKYLKQMYNLLIALPLPISFIFIPDNAPI